MKGYKYVEFSRSTAKKNPQMIINEYNRLLASKEQQINEINRLKLTTKISVLDIKNLQYIIESLQRNDIRMYDHQNPATEIEIEFEYEILMQLVFTLKYRLDEKNNLENQVSDIRNELNTFKNVFVWKE